MITDVTPSNSSRTGQFHIVTLGCSKNRVDSDGMETLLRQRGMTSSPTSDDADVIIINTCGFLGAARDESVAVITDVLAGKQDHQRVIAAGCMPALRDYSNDIPSGVDHILTTREWFKVGEVVGSLFGEAPVDEIAGCEGMLTTFSRLQTGPSAYVKIADGCDHNCAFCTIPTIKGRQVSKPPLHVLQEVIDLVAHGAKEIVLVAQDTIRYGADLGIKDGLPHLLRSIAEQVPNLPWVRLLYIYPTVLTLKMVDVIAEHEALLPYLDMPLQHADREILRAMNRPSDPDMTRRLIDHARAKLPDLTMRTTLIVGYPGETDAQFQTLYEFVAAERFDHVGVFTYSPEAGTKAATLGSPVPAEIADERRSAIMELQQGISLRKNQELVGSELEILIEGIGEIEDGTGSSEPISVGRAKRHAPEVDGLVFLPGDVPIGSLMSVRITDASPYDLWASAATDEPQIPRRRRSRQTVKRRSRQLPMAKLPGT